MKNLFSRILKIYDERDFLLYQKAKVIASLNIVIIALTCITIVSTLAIQVKIKPNIILTESIVLLYGIAALVLLRRGYYHVSAHGIIIAIMIAVWTVMSLDKAHIVSRLDSIAYILAIMTLTSIAVVRRKWIIILYGAVNQVVLIIYAYVFLFLPAETPFIANSSKFDYLLDNSISIFLITFVAYKVFSINQKSLVRAEEEIARRRLSEEHIRDKNTELATTNEELEATNEELQATMEELEASNEEFEVINEELITAYHNLEESEAKLRNIFMAAPVGIISVKNRTIQWASDYFFGMLGYSHDEIVGSDARVFFESEEEYNHLGSFAARALETGKTMELETRYRKKDGTLIDVLLSGRALNPADREPDFIVIAVDISSLKKMENSLMESEEKFRTIAEQSLMGVVMVQNHRFIFVNQAVSDINEYSVEEMLSWTPEKYAETIYPEDLPRILEITRKKENGEMPYAGNNQWRIVARSGKTKWVETSSSPVTIGGKPALLTTVIDITERKKAEKENHERLRSLEILEMIDRAIRGTLDLDKMMKNVLTILLDIYDCDRAWFFYPADPEADTWNLPMVMSRPEYNMDAHLKIDTPMINKMRIAIKSILAKNAPTATVELEGKSLSEITGDYSIKSLLVMPIYPRLGKPWLVGLHQCSHARSWTDSEINLLKETGRKMSDALSSLIFFRDLMESEDRFRTMIDLAPYPIAMSEKDGKVTYLNRAFRDVFGYTHDDLPHLDQWWQKAYPDPVYRDKVSAMWDIATQEALRENRPISPQEWIVTCKDGSMRNIEFRMVPIGDVSFTVMDDLTEKKITQEMMIQSEKMMTVGSLAAGMAHEINNPLGIILQGIQNTLRRVNPDNVKNDAVARECDTAIRQIHGYLEKQNILSYLDGIREAGNRAAKIVASMLQFSRKSDSEMKSVDLNTLIEQTLEIAAQDYDLKKSYDFKKISVMKNFGPAIPAIRCIETEIEQVLLNLLKNAAQAMNEIHDPDYAPEIHITTAQDGEFAILQVYDNGPGIGEDTIKHIFEPFYTTKSVGTGTGLGLSVSYFIITNNHGGEISAESEPGKGVTFTVKIPLAWRMHG
ncbi:MAG: hypothetical protein CVV44_14145 [Spirochaetae bacterium HGW-Spirochaetae-1]|jgi:PAS domain S-box-containing protein|nr:MAG: hypothetical protein CVV44_14145 [Spirochaetae bacterium HGW-Spirochaetae-1]